MQYEARARRPGERWVAVPAAIACGLLLAATYGCSDDEGTVPGPDEDGNIVPADNACRPLPPVNKVALCDGCIRDVCCPQYVLCNREQDCRELVACLNACETGDFNCSADCSSEHAAGAAALNDVETCAQRECPVACQTGAIGDGG